MDQEVNTVINSHHNNMDKMGKIEIDMGQTELGMDNLTDMVDNSKHTLNIQSINMTYRPMQQRQYVDGYGNKYVSNDNSKYSSSMTLLDDGRQATDTNKSPSLHSDQPAASRTEP
jgi:hypothetical protein